MTILHPKENSMFINYLYTIEILSSLSLFQGIYDYKIFQWEVVTVGK